MHAGGEIDRTLGDAEALLHTVIRMARQCGHVDVVCNWEPGEIISLKQKLELLLPLHEVLLRWLPALCQRSGPTLHHEALVQQ